MTLKYEVEDVNTVEEPMRTLYAKDESTGKFVLQVEGAVSTAKVTEFRDNNIKLKQALDKFEGIDPVKYADLMKIDQAIREKALIDKGEVENVVKGRLEQITQEFQTEKQKLENQTTFLTTRLESVLIDSAIKSAAIEAGALPTAVDDVVLRGKMVFKMNQDGDVVALDSKGQVIYGKNGTDPLTIGEWLKDLKVQKAPHLFLGMVGSGAGGGRPGTNVNPANMTATQKIAAGLAGGKSG